MSYKEQIIWIEREKEEKKGEMTKEAGKVKDLCL